MMALDVKNLTKSYKRYSSELKRIFTWFNVPFSPIKVSTVIDNISFSMEKGEAIGIVGKNGAGKSTLLKLIAGVVKPSSGEIYINGKVSGILELGMGFNNNLTGRQNAAYGLGLVGLDQKTVSKTIPIVETFAEIGEYFDRPMRTYSSGMQMRVAFAVATALEPELLIVDEALSVGDIYFQHKSFDKIRKFKETGTAVLFVSHSLEGLKEFCDKAILIDCGKILKFGETNEVWDYYNAFISANVNSKIISNIEQHHLVETKLNTKSGSGDAKILSSNLIDYHTHNNVNNCFVGQKLSLVLKIKSNVFLNALVIGIMIRDKYGNCVWGTNTFHTNQVIYSVDKSTIITCSLTFDCNLGQGSYSFTVSLSKDSQHITNNYEWQDNLLIFEVQNIEKPKFIGSTSLNYEFKIVS